MVRVEPAALSWFEALAEGDDVFTSRFGIPVVTGWAVFPEAIPHVLEELRRGRGDGWGTHLFFDDDEALVGFGGWKGPPVDGVVELGYAVAPTRRGRGVATKVVEQLLARARESGVRLVIAHTLPEESPSTSVLRRAGFSKADVLADSHSGDDRSVWRWELPVPRAPAR